MTIFGDGGQSGINVANPKIRMHTFFSPNGDVNFQGNEETGWDFMAGPLLGSGEGASFYVPLISDPNPAAADSCSSGAARLADAGQRRLAGPAGHPVQRVLRHRAVRHDLR